MARCCFGGRSGTRWGKEEREEETKEQTTETQPQQLFPLSYVSYVTWSYNPLNGFELVCCFFVLICFPTPQKFATWTPDRRTFIFMRTIVVLHRTSQPMIKNTQTILGEHSQVWASLFSLTLQPENVWVKTFMWNWTCFDFKIFTQGLIIFAGVGSNSSASGEMGLGRYEPQGSLKVMTFTSIPLPTCKNDRTTSWWSWFGTRVLWSEDEELFHQRRHEIWIDHLARTCGKMVKGSTQSVPSLIQRLIERNTNILD